MNGLEALAAFFAGLYCGVELCRRNYLAALQALKKQAQELVDEDERFRKCARAIMDLERQANDLAVKTSDTRAEAFERHYHHERIKAESMANEYY